MDRGRTVGDETVPMVETTTPRPMGGPKGNRAPAGQSTPGTKARPQKAKRKGLAPKGGARPQRVCTLGFRAFFVVQRISVRWLPGPQ